PSSACRASNTPSMRVSSIAAAVGSRMTSYLPGSSAVLPRQSRHLRNASSAIRSDSIVFQSAPSSPAQPDERPSGVRIVSVEAIGVDRRDTFSEYACDADSDVVRLARRRHTINRSTRESTDAGRDVDSRVIGLRETHDLLTKLA